jgi:hypothetical protein
VNDPLIRKGREGEAENVLQPEKQIFRVINTKPNMVAVIFKEKDVNMESVFHEFKRIATIFNRKHISSFKLHRCSEKIQHIITESDPHSTNTPSSSSFLISYH